MKKFARVLVYLLSAYTLYVFVREVLITEFGINLSRPFGLIEIDGYLLVGAGGVLGIALYLFGGRFNKIFATVMIAENAISLFIMVKYMI